MLVNNAGQARWVRADTPLETAERLWDEVMTANLKGSSSWPASPRSRISPGQAGES